MINIRVDDSDWRRFKQKFKVQNSIQMLIAMHQSLEKVARNATRDMPARPDRKTPRIPSAKPNIITGRLAQSILNMSGESIRIVTTDGRGVLGQIGSSVPYARKLEKQYPYLKPGLLASVDEIYTIFRVRLAIAIKEADYV